MFPQHGFLSTCIDGKREQLGAKGILFLRPHLEHTFFATAPNRFLVFDLPVALIEAVQEQFTSHHTLPSSYLLPMNQPFASFCHLVNTEASCGGLEEPFLLETLLHHLVALLFLSPQPSSSAPLTAGRTIIAKRMQEYIEAHYTAALSLQEIARAVGASPSYAHRCFTASAGVTVVEYVQRLRLEQAINLLISSDLPLGVISLAVGFHSQSYFTRLFSRKQGISPLHYRNVHQKKATGMSKNRP